MRVLAALLSLGNVIFIEHDDKADVADETALIASEALLGAGKLSSLLTARTMTRGGMCEGRQRRISSCHL